MDESELDPEIAALLSNTGSSYNAEDALASIEETDITPSKPTDKTSFTSSGNSSLHTVDLNKKGFDKIEQLVNDNPSDVFDDPKYYKTALSNENASAQRVHQVLSKYLTSQDPKDRAVYRQQIVTCYWELLRGMAPKMSDYNLPMPKKMLMRYGVLLPSLFKPETKTFFSKIFLENKENEPVLYVDEWFKEIASGRMKNSMTDEKKQPQKNLTADEAATAEQSRLMQLQSKNSGRLQTAENILGIKENERNMIEVEIRNRIENLFIHPPIIGMEPHTSCLSDSQRRLFSEISELMHRYTKNDKEMSKALEEFKEAKSVYDSVESKLSNGPAKIATVDAGAVSAEFDTIRQMAKMTVGRRGNQFPIFTREFYHCTEKGTGTRENVISILSWIESIDPGVFLRIHKNVPNRIVPYVLLVPTYGDRGFCWEPFDRYNRVTSRGRIVVPMYPRDLTIAVLTAVADLRWQVAKEKASFYWMEEGLTGQYYQHYEQMKLKGDLKEYFIEDYILWMTKESIGVQRLERDVRGIFWRNMPFPKELKEDLRKRSLVYDELCKKDANREMSDGY
ncbi:MAG: hypothetical protein J5527_02775 [Treponema sp.]|nr:hypothetical protein [Treponema sp.]